MTRERTDDALLEQVAATIARDGVIASGERVVVGFSGGADSTALLLALQSLGYAPRAVHLHHGLRGEAADADLAWCEAFCGSQDIPFTAAWLDPTADPAGEGLEAALRRQRLDWWRAHTAADEVVALGHHADDALETMMMNLMRGANSSGLTALRTRRVVAGVTLVRPLLAVKRTELLAWLRAHGVDDWREDATNAEPMYLRNRVRLELLPLLRELAGEDSGLTLCLEHLRQDAEALEAGLADIPLDADGGLAEAALLGAPRSYWPRLLRQMGAAVGTELPWRGAAIDRLHDWLTRQPDATDGQMDLDGDFVLLRHAGRLRITPRPSPIPTIPDRLWDWRATPVLELPELGARLRCEPAPPADGSVEDSSWGQGMLLRIMRSPQHPHEGDASPSNPLSVSWLRKAQPTEKTAGSRGMPSPSRGVGVEPHEAADAPQITHWPAGALPCPLTVRARQPGDRITPFGMTESVRVKKVVGGSSLKPAERRRVIVVAGPDGTVLWLPGVRRAADLPITAATEATIALIFESDGLL